MFNKENFVKEIKSEISQIKSSDELIELAATLKIMQIEIIEKLKEEKINE